MAVNIEGVSDDSMDYDEIQNPLEYLNLTDKEEVEEQGKIEIPGKHKEDVYTINNVLLDRRRSSSVKDNYDTKDDISVAFKKIHQDVKESHVDYLLDRYFDKIGSNPNKLVFELKKQYVLPNPEQFGPPEMNPALTPEEKNEEEQTWQMSFPTVKPKPNNSGKSE